MTESERKGAILQSGGRLRYNEYIFTGANMKKFEKETSIWFNEEDQQAHLYTYNKSLLNRLSKLSKQYPEEVILHRSPNNDAESAEYILPKSYIFVRRKKQLTETQRETNKRNAVHLANVARKQA